VKCSFLHEERGVSSSTKRSRTREGVGSSVFATGKEQARGRAERKTEE